MKSRRVTRRKKKGPARGTRRRVGGLFNSSRDKLYSFVTGKPSSDKLIESIKNDKIEEVKILLDKGANVNAVDKSGLTALMIAAMNGNIDIVNMLLEKKADINATTKTKKTALIWATISGQTDIVKLLLDKGVILNPNIVNSADKNGMTLLMFAAYGGFEDIVELLLQKGANVNTVATGGTFRETNETHKYDQTGMTALMFAAFSNFKHLKDRDYMAIVKLLVEKGAKINMVSNNGETALQYATHRHYSKDKKIPEYLGTL
jgi:ankyrin repeat protein